MGPDAINSYEQGSSAGGYTARAGDTLQSIALNLWGDASLWYKLAEANPGSWSGAGGLGANAALSEGQSLTLPAGAMSNKHSADTFKPYDPAKALGDLSPTAIKPAKKNSCAMIGQILMVVVAVAVTAITGGAAVAALTPGMSLMGGMTAFATGSATFGTMVAAGAAGGAAGSIASQGAGIAMGLQNKLSWSNVATSAISGAIGAGLGKIDALAKVAGSKVVGGAVRGALGSALTQGIGVATKLQKSFDFAGVAAAGIGGGAGVWAGGRLGAGSLTDLSARNVAANLGSAAAGGIANATTRSMITGTSFGDNLIAALPDIVGSTIGNMIAGAVQGNGRRAVGPIAAGPSLVEVPNNISIAEIDTLAPGSAIADAVRSLPSLEQFAGAAEFLPDAEGFITLPSGKRVRPQAIAMNEGMAPRHGSPGAEVVVDGGPRLTRFHIEGLDHRRIPIGSDGTPIFYGILEWSRNGELGNFQDSLLSLHGDVDGLSAAVFSLLQTYYEDVPTWAGLYEEQGGLLAELAPALRERQARWAAEHPYRSTAWGITNGAAGIIESGWDGLWSFSELTGPGRMELNPVTGDVTGSHPLTTTLGHIGNYGVSLYNREASLIQDVRNVASTTYGNVANGLSDIRTSYDIGGIPAVVDIHGRDIGYYGTGTATMIAGLWQLRATSGMNLLRSGTAAEGGSARFVDQGFTVSQAEYLAAPYEGMGHHAIPRRTGLPSVILENPLNILRPNGISRGDFYELHFRVDPYFSATRLPASVGGGVWNGIALGLERYGTMGRLWYGTATPLKVTIGTAATGTGGAIYLYQRGDK